MKNSRLVWDEKTLDLFLKGPTRLVPGTAMTYDGVPDPQERQDLIAYLKKAGQSDACKP
ncbi:Cytochrome c2 precursor [compost metagenome]